MSDLDSRQQRIEATLRSAFPDASFELVDESHLHRGHAGARDGKGHFRLHIVSEAFAGLLPLARHRKVFSVLGALLETDIHAVSIQARTPAERS